MKGYSVVGRDAEVLADRFTWISRGVVRGGWIASLWRVGHRRAAGVLAAIAVTPRSPDGWADPTNGELKAWSGASAPTVRHTLDALRHAGLLVGSGERRPGRARRHVRLAPSAVTLESREAFLFPGWIIANGVWPELHPGEQAVAFALASELGTTRWVPDADDRSTGCPDMHAWLPDYDSITAHTPDGAVPECDGPDTCWPRTVRRTGQVSLDYLSAVSGMDASAVSRCVRGLETFVYPHVLVVHSDRAAGQCNWYHLPAQGWVAPVHLRDQGTPHPNS